MTLSSKRKNLKHYTGIEVEIAGQYMYYESYTSQTCSRCGTVDKTNRVYRGLYVCKECGVVINADVNGALNILKKVSPNSHKGIGVGVLANPMRLRLVS